MEESKVFKTINRINSVVFLVLLLTGLGAVGISFLLDGFTGRESAVNVVDNEHSGEAKQVQLKFDGLHKVSGHDVGYVQLATAEAKRKGIEYSSGSADGENRNILFFVGPEMESHWLFETHANLILEFSELKVGDDFDEKKPVKAFYLEVASKDTNGDGLLDREDDISIGLAKPDGKQLTIIAKSTQSIIDTTVGDDETLIILSRVDNAVWMKKYSLADFKMISEKKLAGLDIANQ